MEYVSDRIKQKRLELKLNQRELAKKLKLTAPSISQWERGVSEPKGNNLINLAKLFRTTPEWILTGELQHEEKLLCVEVPLLEGVFASGGFGACNDSFGEASMVPIPYYVVKYRNIKNIECIQVMGDSMEPVLCDGGLVVIDRSETAIRDGKIYVFRHDGMIRVKQLVNINSGVIAKSYNSSYKEEILVFDETVDFEVLGRAIWEASNL